MEDTEYITEDRIVLADALMQQGMIRRLSQKRATRPSFKKVRSGDAGIMSGIADRMS